MYIIDKSLSCSPKSQYDIMYKLYSNKNDLKTGGTNSTKQGQVMMIK